MLVVVVSNLGTSNELLWTVFLFPNLWYLALSDSTSNTDFTFVSKISNDRQYAWKSGQWLEFYSKQKFLAFKGFAKRVIQSVKKDHKIELGREKYLKTERQNYAKVPQYAYVAK